MEIILGSRFIDGILHGTLLPKHKIIANISVMETGFVGCDSQQPTTRNKGGQHGGCISFYKLR
jgi:hypothetical protein